MARGSKRQRVQWDASRLQALRRHMGMTQDAMAEELGTRQQTISEWERGLYKPRGASQTLLTLVAEQAGFDYDASGSTTLPSPS